MADSEMTAGGSLRIARAKIAPGTEVSQRGAATGPAPPIALGRAQDHAAEAR